jgi:F-type H+-transporting ATPase subunit delta
MSRFARPYAQAFLEMAPAGFDVEAFLERATVLSRALASDRRLKSFLAAPSVPIEAKRGVLDDLVRRVEIDDFGQRFLRLVLDNRRILALDEILSAIGEARDRQEGVVEAFVTVAAPLADGDRTGIEQALARQLKRRVRMKVRVDPSILAGFVARVGSEVFDASVLRAIERFQVEAAATAG